MRVGSVTRHIGKCLRDRSISKPPPLRTDERQSEVPPSYPSSLQPGSRNRSSAMPMHKF